MANLDDHPALDVPCCRNSTSSAALSGARTQKVHGKLGLLDLLSQLRIMIQLFDDHDVNSGGWSLSSVSGCVAGELIAGVAALTASRIMSTVTNA